jgi:hypothetical protein
MWFFFQSLIIFAVVASNIHCHWTPLTLAVADWQDMRKRKR